MSKTNRKQKILVCIKSFASIILIVLFVASCGYQSVRANLVGGGSRIAVPIAQNHTAFKGLAGPLTTALRKKIAKAGIEVLSSDHGGPRLEVALVMVENVPGMLTVNGGNLDALDNIRSIHARASLIDTDSEILDGPHHFEVRGRAYAGGNPVSDEAIGARKLRSLLDDLATNIVAHFMSM